MHNFAVIPASKTVCDEWIRAKHYTRRASIFWAGFALVEAGSIVGVAVYGQPSPPIQRSAFRDRDFRLYELSRVVVQTESPNAASFLVAGSLRQLPAPCAVVSYADAEQGHCGIIYQATNWVYTGGTKSHDKTYLVDGVPTHPLTLASRGIKDPVRWARENSIPTVPPGVKHRYFQFVGDRRAQKHMRSRLVYPVIRDYPKCDQQRYDDGPLLARDALELLV